MCDTAQLVPIRFWRMGHGRMVKTLATTLGVGVSLRFRGPRFNTGIHLMKQFAHNWYLPCCQCTETCSHVSFIHKLNIWARVTCICVRKIIIIVQIMACYLIGAKPDIKKDPTLLLTHWGYIFLALTHRFYVKLHYDNYDRLSHTTATNIAILINPYQYENS